jgi:hypothetical protein
MLGGAHVTRPLAAALAALLVAGGLTARPWAQVQEPVDFDAVSRIKAEGLERSQVMDTLWHLTDRYGGRLTNSPAMHEAAEWAAGRLREWGIPRVYTENWGEFGQGWANEHIAVNVVEPVAFPLTAFAQAWTPGTDGEVTADAVLAVINNPGDFDDWRGRLEGRVVLASGARDVDVLFDPLGRRFTDEQLEAVVPERVDPDAGNGGGGGNAVPFALRRMRFFAEEGVVAVLEPGFGRSDHGTVWVTGPRQNRDPDAEPIAAHVSIPTEQYNRIARLLARDVPVRLTLDVRSRFYADDLSAYNLLAELPGTDLADEVVMLGAHFDSWHSGTGATDNAAGSAAMMEALRILHASGLPLRRTVRLALWTGEEQGLLGSQGYVAEHFAPRDTMDLRPGHAGLSAYFNMDNGTGAIRGVYLEGNDAIRPIFRAWMEPLESLGMTTLSMRGTGGTDHLRFDEVGLPGFQFIQDPVEYGTHSHHTQMDLYDRVQAEDLMKNAAIIATFVYHAANRDALLPRQALPAPLPPEDDDE